MKNVIIVNDFDYTQGGASKVAIDTANLLVESQKNIKVYFFSGSHNDSSNLDKRVVRICTNQGEFLKDKNILRGMINGIYNFKARKKFKNLLKSLDINNTIIHIHGWTKCLSSSIFDIAFKMKYKFVVTMHDYFIACPNGGYFNYKKNEICQLKPLSMNCIKCNCDSRNYGFKLYRVIRHFVQNKIVNFNNKITDVISISEFSENILKKTLNEKVNIHRVYNPIDYCVKTKTVDFDNNEYYLYVGRLSKEKGVDIFCKAITNIDAKGIVVGDGDEKEKLESIYTNVKFVGWKTSEEVREYMKNARALIFPSKLYETAGLTVIEAQQLGLPVFVSNVTAGKEFCEGANKDLLFNPNDIDDLIKKIKKFEKNDITMYSESSIKTYKKYKKNIYIDDILEAYSNIIGRDC